MTKNRPILTAFLATAMLSSCTSTTTVIRGDEDTGRDFIDIVIDEKAPPVDANLASINLKGLGKKGDSSKKKGRSTTKSTKNNANAPVTADQPTEYTTIVEEAPAADEPKKTNVQPPVIAKSEIDGNWAITDAGGYHVDAEIDLPYIIFSDKDARFYASNGCNIINGSYKFAPESNVVTLANVITTMMLCSDTGYEKAISDILVDGYRLTAKVAQRDNESIMTLYDTRGRAVMTMLRHNLETINGQWEVEEIDDEEVAGDVFNVFFDITEHTIHGNTGCNYFNGRITVDPQTPSSISFSQMGVTMRLCPNQEIERKMLVALESTTGYRLDGGDLYLLDADGNELMHLIKSE